MESPIFETEEQTPLSPTSSIQPYNIENAVEADSSHGFDVHSWRQSFQQLPCDIGHVVQSLVADRLRHVDRAAMVLTQQKEVLIMKEKRISELSSMMEAFVKRLQNLQVCQTSRTLPQANIQIDGDQIIPPISEDSRQLENALQDKQSQKDGPVHISPDSAEPRLMDDEDVDERQSHEEHEDIDEGSLTSESSTHSAQMEQGPLQDQNNEEGQEQMSRGASHDWLSQEEGDVNGGLRCQRVLQDSQLASDSDTFVDINEEWGNADPSMRNSSRETSSTGSHVGMAMSTQVVAVQHSDNDGVSLIVAGIPMNQGKSVEDLAKSTTAEITMQSHEEGSGYEDQLQNPTSHSFHQVAASNVDDHSTAEASVITKASSKSLLPHAEIDYNLSASSVQASCQSELGTNGCGNLEGIRKVSKPGLEFDGTLDMLEQVVVNVEDVMATWATAWQPFVDNLAEVEMHYVEQQRHIDEQIAEIEKYRSKQHDLESRLADSDSRCAEKTNDCEKLLLEVDDLRASEQQLEQKALESEKELKAMQEILADTENRCKVLQEQLDSSHREVDDLKGARMRDTNSWEAEREKLKQLLLDAVRSGQEALDEASSKAQQQAYEEASSKASAEIAALQRHVEMLSKELDLNKQNSLVRSSHIKDYQQKRLQLQAEEDVLAYKMLDESSVAGAPAPMKQGAFTVVPHESHVRSGMRPFTDVLLPPLRHSGSDPQIRSSHDLRKNEVKRTPLVASIGNNRFYQNELRALARHSMQHRFG